MITFGRVATAMVTPFDNEGNVDFKKTTELVNYLIENGTDSLVISGTTGESPTLTADEKVALFRHVVQTVQGKVPVIAGTGSYDTRSSIELTKRAEEAGVDAVMLVAPYYNKPSQEGMYQHFTTIAKETKLPVIIYNVPGRTVVKINADTVVRLSKIDNIVAVKDAGGDLVEMTKMVSETADDFLVYSGDDGITLPALSIGAYGVISVASHVIGNEMSQMIKAFVEGKTSDAAKLHQKLLPLMQGLFFAPNPVPVKTALQMQGIDVANVRLPLIPLNEQERKVLENLLQAVK